MLVGAQREKNKKKRAFSLFFRATTAYTFCASRATNITDHFRVAVNLIMKARLSAKFLL